MSLGVSLFEQRQPSFVLVFALRKVKRLGSCLHDFPILIVRVGHVNRQPLILLPTGLVKVLFGQVELVVDDLRYPLAILRVSISIQPESRTYRGGRRNRKPQLARLCKHTSSPEDLLCCSAYRWMT